MTFTANGHRIAFSTYHKSTTVTIMSAFNRVYLSLSLFMFFVVLGAITSPLAAAKPPTDRVWNPGIAPDLYKLLKIGGLTTRMRLRRRKSWPDGEDLVTLAKMSPLVSPTEHWTLYFGETIAYDFLIHKTLYAIVSAKATTKSHVKTPWDRDGRLGLIVFSTMEKVTTFKELHDQLSTHAQGYNNVSFYSNILGFLVQRHRNGKIKKLDVNYEWWYALLIPMVRGCGNGTGYLEKDCNKLLYLLPSAPAIQPKQIEGHSSSSPPKTLPPSGKGKGA